MNYERVRDLLKHLDTSYHGTVSVNEIRSIIEDLIDYTLKPDEYYQLLKQIPIDEHGRVKYKEYLKQVLDRALSSQEQQQQQQQQKLSR
jgi:Ca2+-binding EF-hand superfamily protein